MEHSIWCGKSSHPELSQKNNGFCGGSFFMSIKGKMDILGHEILRQQDMVEIAEKLEKTGNFALFRGIDFKQIIRYDLCHKVGGNPNSAQKVGESGRFPGTDERRAHGEQRVYGRISSLA
ncbi:MAG: hypothetical protein ACI4OJ_13805 [Lachnospiraceae bacterium]